MLFIGKKVLQRMNRFYKVIYFLHPVRSSKDYGLAYRQESRVLSSRNSESRNIDHYLKDKMVSFGLLLHKAGVQCMRGGP